MQHFTFHHFSRGRRGESKPRWSHVQSVMYLRAHLRPCAAVTLFFLSLRATLLLVVIALFVATLPVAAQAPAWEVIDGLYGGDVRAVYETRSGVLLASTDWAIFKFDSTANRWRRTSRPQNLVNVISTLFEHPSGMLIAGTDFGIYLSADQGDTWTQPVGRYSENGDFGSFVMEPSGNLFASSWQHGVLMSADTGRSWSLVFSRWSTGTLVRHPSGWLITFADSGIYRAEHAESTWTFTRSPMWPLGLRLASSGRLYLYGQEGLSFSDDTARTWQPVSIPVSYLSTFNIAGNGDFFLGAHRNFFRSSDEGATWTGPAEVTEFIIHLSEDSSGNLYAGCLTDGVFRSTDRGLSWVEMNDGLTSGRILLLHAAPWGDIFTTSRRQLFVSHDDGLTWNAVLNGTNAVSGPVASTADGDLFVADLNSWSILRSTDHGTSWTSSSIRSPAPYIIAIAAAEGQIVLAVSSGGEMFRSADGGKTWSTVLNVGPVNTVKFVMNTVRRWFFISGSTTYRSDDLGAHWQAVGTITGSYWPDIRDLAVTVRDYLFAATEEGVFRSTDDGVNWRLVGTPSYQVNALVADANDRLYAKIYGRMQYSDNGGQTWIDFNDGYDGDWFGPIVISATGRLIVGSAASGAFRTLETVAKEKIPTSFAIKFAYPNPFNSSTVIEVALSSAAMVTVKAFDMRGRDLGNVYNGEAGPGTKRIRWNATGRASGIYFLRVKAGSVERTVKVVLLR